MSDQQNPKSEEQKMSEFTEHLKNSKRILAIVGAGLSASSGIATYVYYLFHQKPQKINKNSFQNPRPDKWENYTDRSISFPMLFKKDPGILWQIFTDRRRESLAAEPNAGHFALAELAKKCPGFMTMSQNVDGLSIRASHPPDQIIHLHGSLFTIKCSNTSCTYISTNHYDNPLCPALATTTTTTSKPKKSAFQARLDLLEPTSTPEIPPRELPHCPNCGELLRPGVTWFGEGLDGDVVKRVDAWFEGEVDLVLVVGTSLSVMPAVAYVDMAKEKGAKVAVVDVEVDGAVRVAAGNGGWLFRGDAAVVLPRILEGVVGLE